MVYQKLVQLQLILVTNKRFWSHETHFLQFGDRFHFTVSLGSRNTTTITRKAIHIEHTF